MTKRMSNSLYVALIAVMVLSLLPLNKAYAKQKQFNDASIELNPSTPGDLSNWTITVTTKQAIPADGTITITPEATEFSIPAAMDFEDLDLSIGGSDVTLAAAAGSGAGTAWGVTVTSGASGNIELENNDTDTVAASTAIIIEIGTHAAFGVVGAEQITNPTKTAAVGTADILTIDVTSADDTPEVIDTIDLLAAIVEAVEVNAAQKPQMTFTVSGITAPAGGAITADSIEWQEVTPGTPKTAVMRVLLNTDAKDGFYVYIAQNNNMQHDEDITIDIDPINNAGVGTNNSPVAWTSPTGSAIGVDTGFLGYTTSDTSLNAVGDGVNRFSGATLYAGLTTTSEEVLYHDRASQGTTDGEDQADITFQLETNNLQPSGNYQNELTFIAMPIF